MKKLMIAAAIVCAAVMSQAASFRWTTSGVLDADKKAAYSGSATLYAALVTAGVAGEYFTVAEGSMANGTIGKVVTDGDKFTQNATYSFYYQMTDEKGNVFTSASRTSVAQKSGTPTLGFGSEGAWAVPEPTSGLLLLLGVAGLALRRRRA